VLMSSLVTSVVLRLACLPLNPRFAGSIPTKAMDFKDDKNSQHSFGGEVKLETPCHKLLQHVKVTCKHE
jgi:hypothetical protein